MDLKSMLQAGWIDTLGCFDRLLFTGYNHACYALGMNRLLRFRELSVADFQQFAEGVTQGLRSHVEKLTAKHRVAITPVHAQVRKEERAREIAEASCRSKGLVAVLTAVEPSMSYSIVRKDGGPFLKKALRRCLTYYFYLQHAQLGFMFVRVPTWLPFTLQIYVNGHELLARAMQHRRMRFLQLRNCFVHIASPARAQALADQIASLDWQSVLTEVAQPFVEPIQQAMGSMGEYRWVIDQSEYALDHIFRDPQLLSRFEPDLLRHAMNASTQDVLTFHGKRDVRVSDVTGHLGHAFQGLRVKHEYGRNSVKLYVKSSNVLRLEATINDVTQIKERRVRGKRRRKSAERIRKGVGAFPALQRQARLMTKRYATFMAGATDRSQSREDLLSLGARVQRNGRTHRGLNPSRAADLALLTAIAQGQHAVHGFRNQDIRFILFGDATSPAEAKRHAARVGRLFGILRAHRLIARIPRSHRWRLTPSGSRLVGALLRVHNEAFPAAHAA